jgi:energy-coupling factor transport system permease protein
MKSLKTGVIDYLAIGGFILLTASLLGVKVLT